LYGGLGLVREGMLFDEPQRLRGLTKADARLGCGGIVEDV